MKRKGEMKMKVKVKMKVKMDIQLKYNCYSPYEAKKLSFKGD